MAMSYFNGLLEQIQLWTGAEPDEMDRIVTCIVNLQNYYNTYLNAENLTETILELAQSGRDANDIISALENLIKYKQVHKLQRGRCPEDPPEM